MSKLLFLWAIAVELIMMLVHIVIGRTTRTLADTGRRAHVMFSGLLSSDGIFAATRPRSTTSTAESAMKETAQLPQQPASSPLFPSTTQDSTCALVDGVCDSGRPLPCPGGANAAGPRVEAATVAGARMVPRYMQPTASRRSANAQTQEEARDASRRASMHMLLGKDDGSRVELYGIGIFIRSSSATNPSSTSTTTTASVTTGPWEVAAAAEASRRRYMRPTESRLSAIAQTKQEAREALCRARKHLFLGKYDSSRVRFNHAGVAAVTLARWYL